MDRDQTLTLERKRGCRRLYRDPNLEMYTAVGGSRSDFIIAARRTAARDSTYGCVHAHRSIAIESRYQMRNVLDRYPNLERYTSVGGSRSNFIITSCITVDRDPIYDIIHVVRWIAVQFWYQTWCVLDRDPNATMHTSVGEPRYIVSITAH